MRKIRVTYERETSLPEWADYNYIKMLYERHRSLRKVAQIVGVSYETIRLILKNKAV